MSEHDFSEDDINYLRTRIRNGEFIVRAINSHAALVEALKAALVFIEDILPGHHHAEPGSPEHDSALISDKIAAALRKATQP